MKKFRYLLMALPVAFLWSCSADEGSDAGSDPNPSVTVFSYSPEDPDMNPDNDVAVRMATNSATTELYYYVEPSADVESFISQNGEEAYVSRVMENGTKVEVSGAENVDITVTDLHGPCTISAVATNGSSAKRAFVTFTGLDWTKVKDGVFMYNQQFLPQQKQVELQVCTTDETLYRIYDVFNGGLSMKFQLSGYTGKDEDGEYKLLRIPNQNTGWAIKLTDGNTYPLLVQDIGYWQGNSSFVQPGGGYESGMYEDGFCFFYVAWMAGSAGCLEYGYSFFQPY